MKTFALVNVLQRLISDVAITWLVEDLHTELPVGLSFNWGKAMVCNRKTYHLDCVVYVKLNSD